MIGAVLKLIIFTSMVNRIINTSRNERVTQQVYDTYLQMFDVCTLRHTAHIEAIVQFLPYSAQQLRCDVSTAAVILFFKSGMLTGCDGTNTLSFTDVACTVPRFNPLWLLPLGLREGQSLCHHNPWAYLIWRTELPRLWRPSHLTCWADYGRNWTIALMCAVWRRVHTSNICRYVS